MCGEGRVPGAIRIGSVWGISEDAEKPADARIKNGKYIKKPSENEKCAALPLVGTIEGNCNAVVFYKNIRSATWIKHRKT